MLSGKWDGWDRCDGWPKRSQLAYRALGGIRPAPQPLELNSKRVLSDSKGSLRTVTGQKTGGWRPYCLDPMAEEGRNQRSEARGQGRNGTDGTEGTDDFTDGILTKTKTQRDGAAADSASTSVGAPLRAGNSLGLVATSVVALLVLLLAGCKPEPGTSAPRQELRTVVIDHCEYLEFEGAYGNCGYTHKGNCTNHAVVILIPRRDDAEPKRKYSWGGEL